VKLSNGAGHLKTARGKGADRREEVRLHTNSQGVHRTWILRSTR
jgi:hypothetical protein